MRIALEHAAVHESAGVALVGIADDILLLAGGLRHRAPLQPGGIASSASSSQTALDDLLDDFGGRHLRQYVDQCAVSGCAHILFHSFGINDAGILQNDFLLALEERNVGAAYEPIDR